MPSAVVDRDFQRTWQEKGSKNTAERAHERVRQLVAAYEPSEKPDEVLRELESITLKAAREYGLDRLPSLDAD
jgi:trimethylamine:corrinoid methyltransferase-like protein